MSIGISFVLRSAMLAALAAGVAATLSAQEAPGAAPGADSTNAVEDVHFHPVEPRQVRAALVWGL